MDLHWHTHKTQALPFKRWWCDYVSFSAFIVFLFLFFRICFLPLFASSVFHRLITILWPPFTWALANLINLLLNRFWIKLLSLFNSCTSPHWFGLWPGWDRQYGSHLGLSSCPQCCRQHLPHQVQRAKQSVPKAQYCLFQIQMFSWIHTDFSAPTCQKHNRNDSLLLVSLLFRYHPIDDEDDITETSARGNNVVLRSK